MDTYDERSISRHRLSGAPGQVYVRTILKPSYDFMLDHYYLYLVDANRAWITMLAEESIVSAQTASIVLQGLRQMRAEGPSSLPAFDEGYEYFYSHFEQRLTELVGVDAAGEINIARTRPEPLTRMALRDEVLDVFDRSVDLVLTLLDLGDKELESVMPQWTHMQPAQPSTLGHYFAGMSDAILRDLWRLKGAYNTTNVCTLGCGALAGSSYRINRSRVAELLSFDGVRENSIDCVASADHVSETAAALAGLGINLSRLSEDLYLWCTEEFGFAEVADEFAGSSSMMPQKKNAYPFEYVRARAARSVSDASSIYMVLHNTNFGDTKDVEEEVVPPIMRMLDEMTGSLDLLSGTVGSMAFHRERMVNQAAAGFSTATELAAIVHRNTNLDFRSAHKVVGSLVRLSVERGISAEGVTSSLLDEAAEDALGVKLGLTDAEIHEGLDPRRFVEAHTSQGGAAPASVRVNIANAYSVAKEFRNWLGLQRSRVGDVDGILEGAGSNFV